MLNTAIQIKTDHFDGPLSLLLHLIQKEEMDLRNLDLTKITQQYLDYLSNMRQLNFDIAGDYLYMAATLLLLKSKRCVEEQDAEKLQDQFNGHEKPITTQAELIRRLEELEHFQRMSKKLWELPKLGHEVFIKPKINRKQIINSILLPVELDLLTESMLDFIRKQKRKYAVVKRDRLSIKEKLVKLKSFLRKGNRYEMGKILEEDIDQSISNLVITFISLLELARLGKIELTQDEVKRIFLDVKEDLNDFDVDQADGFETEDESEDQQDLPAQADVSPEVNTQVMQ